MQRWLTKRRSNSPRYHGAERETGRQITLGLVVVAVVILLLAGAAVVYLLPPGRKTVSFVTTDAAAVSGGEDVRVAGVSIGKVSKVSLGAESVTVEAEVEKDVFIGSDSEVEVRLLTPVGGYYVTILPNGRESLADGAVIPADRVRMPYSIADILQETPPITDKVDGKTLDADVRQVADGLSHNWTSIGSMIDGLDSIATIMANQREQIHLIMSMVNEYSTAFNQSKEFLFPLLQKVEAVLGTYNTYSAGFNETYQLFGDVFQRVSPLLRYFLDHKMEVRAAVDKARTAIDDFRANADPVIGQLTVLRDQIVQWLTPEGVAEIGGGQIFASQLCIPIPGRTC